MFVQEVAYSIFCVEDEDRMSEDGKINEITLNFEGNFSVLYGASEMCPTYRILLSIE